MNHYMDGFFEIFTKSDFVMTNILFAGLLVLTFFVLLLYLPLLSKVFFPSFGYKKYSDYLPFEQIMPDGLTVKLKDGSLVRAFRIPGVQNGMKTDAELTRLFEIKQNLFNQIKDTGATLRFYTIRTADNTKTDYEFDQPVLQRIYNKWNAQGLKIFDNTNYMTITVTGAEAADRMFNNANTISSVLSPYGVRPLYHNDKDNIAALFAKILSPVSRPELPTAGLNMNEMISTDNVEFLPDGFIRYSFGGNVKFAQIVSFKIAPDFIDTAFWQSAQSLPAEMIIMNAMSVKTGRDMEKFFRKKQASESSEGQAGEIVAQQINQAEYQTNENIQGNQTFVGFYPCFVIFGETTEKLGENINELKKICAGFGVSPVVEDFAAKVSFFALMPGFDEFPRGFNLLSNAAAASLTMDMMPPGIENSDWGPGPIVIFPTSSGTPYRFQFHVSDSPGAVGHSLVIGPTGGGKTTLFSFLISQSLRHPKLKAFFFDRNRGAEIFTMATGGKYVSFEGGGDNTDNIAISHRAKLNPLLMEDTVTNRDFLRRWMSMVSNADAPTDMDEIARAVSVSYDYLAGADRKLSNLFVPCFSGDGAVRAGLKKWVDPLQYGKIFNDPEDTLDLLSRLTTFDFTEIFNDSTLAPAVLSYILHRINTMTVSQGAPSLIMIDETAPMLENKMFRDNFIVGLQEGRKNRQAYMAAFQRANILDGLGIGDVVRGQAQTVIFFRNPAAATEDYAHWRLNPTEMAFIKGQAYPNLKRAILLSRPVTNESVILNTELGGLGSLIKLFESGRPSVLLAEELYRQYGVGFVDHYLKHVESS